MSAALWDAMLVDACSWVSPEDTVVSGGAAWADHLAVRLYLESAAKHLVLHLPAPLEGQDGNGPLKYAGAERNSAGSAANYYHGLFTRITGVNGLKDIAAAIKKGAEVTYEPVATGYGAMFARNKKVAERCDSVLAYTFGAGDVPADGGTKDTWDKFRAPADSKIHIDLASLPLSTKATHAAAMLKSFAAAPVPVPAPVQSSRPAPVKATAEQAAGPSESTRSRLANMGRRPTTYRPR